MKVLIATDMEGVTGVTAAEDISPGTAAWERFRRLFMRDVNAAIAGAFDGGADDVLVIEGHNRMRNLAIEELDERAQLLTGNHKTYVMMEGIDRDIDLVFFVGYHAPAGEEGVLSHTFLGKGIVDLTLDGETCSEGRMNAMLAGAFGVGVGLLTGDDAACADASRHMPGVRTVAVKEYIDRYSAICLPPARTEAMIREAAAAAVKDEVAVHPPVTSAAPYRWSATFASPSSAGRAALIPGVERVEAKTVAWSSDDYGESLQTFQVVAMLVGASFESPLLD
jgi:D-amino peptidase